MRKATSCRSASIVMATLSMLIGCGVQPQEPTPRALSSAPDDGLLRWALPPGAEAYADIDGRRLHEYVVEQAAISRRYRDQGQPRFWGRITGTSGDAESAEWLITKFREIGLSDVRAQSFDLEPQWMPLSWEVTVTAGGETMELESAQPAYRANPTPPQGLDLEAVYVGLGSEADFAGREVRGKAVLALRTPLSSSEEALQRADSRGAAVILNVPMLSGNMRYQAYPSGTDAPTFTLGGDDGYAVRELIGQAEDGNAPRVAVNLDVELRGGLETALVWGTLPGRTDETIYVMAHRDGWFDAAGDNASGVASMIGLAEHYAKMTRAERRRTLVFVGLDGHHNTGPGQGVGRRWMVDHRDELFADTALLINLEHPATLQTTLRPRYQGTVQTADGPNFQDGNDIVWSNTYMPQQWYAGGPSRPELQAIAAQAFREFGVSTYVEPNPVPPAGDLGRFWQFVPGLATSEFYHYFHTDRETPETVPWTGLEAATRAHARIIDEVNKLELSDLQRPSDP